MCTAWLSLPMRDTIFSVFIFVDIRYSMVSCTQAVFISLGNNTLRDRFWMSHPRHVLSSASQTSPKILRSERGSSLFSVSGEFSGLNMVWMTNKAAFLALST